MGREKNLIEIIRVDQTQHSHIFKRTDNLFEEITDKNEEGEDIIIKVEPKDLYEVGPNHLINFFVWVFTGRIKHYVMIVNSKGIAIKEKLPDVTGKVLIVARDWKGLDKAINDSFGSRFQIPRIALVGVVGLAVLALAFLVWRGIIPLPARWSI